MTLATQAQGQAALAQIATAKSYIGPASPSNMAAGFCDQATGQITRFLARLGSLGMVSQNAVAALTADATALTTAAASLTGAPQTAATAAATAATAAAAALSTAIGVTFPLQGEIQAAQAALVNAAASLSAGPALTAVQAAQSTLSGLVS